MVHHEPPFPHGGTPFADTLLGGLALARFGSFRRRTLFSGMISAPLVMPEVITGLSLLVLFVTLAQIIGWPGERGITISMAYVTVIIQSRLHGMDADLEDAAMDLGGRPLRVLFDITLPLLAPAMIAGWLLAFTPLIRRLLSLSHRSSSRQIRSADQTAFLQGKPWRESHELKPLVVIPVGSTAARQRRSPPAGRESCMACGDVVERPRKS